MLGSRRVIDGAVAQHDVCRTEGQAVQDGRHHREEFIGVRSVCVEDHLATSELVSVELADICSLDRLGQQGPGLTDDFASAGFAEAVVGQSTASDDGVLDVGLCFVCAGHA